MNAEVFIGVALLPITLGSLAAIVRQRIRFRWERPGAVFRIIGAWWALVNVVSLAGFLIDAYVCYPDPSTSVPQAWVIIVSGLIVSSIAVAVVATLVAIVFAIQQVIAYRKEQ